MSLDRMDSVFIGNRCEADSCECVVVIGQGRCYDHSADRLIEALFVNEECKFGGVNCEGEASRVNEHDVLMCENCYNVYQRIQLGRANRNIEYNIAVRQYVDILMRDNEEMSE